MKILHIVNIDFVIPYFFGEQIKYLKANANHETFIACRPSKHSKELEEKFDFKFLDIPIKREFNILSDLNAINKVIQYIKIYDFDLIVGHTPKGGLISSLCSRLTKTRNLYWRHGLPLETLDGLKRRILIIIERLNSFLSEKTICVSNSVLHKSLDLKLTKKNKLIIGGKGSCNGVDTDHFVSFKSINPNSLSFGFIGRVTPDKGIDQLIKAWSLLSPTIQENHKLIIAGPIDERIPISKESEFQINNSDSIQYLGELNEPLDFYNKIDILVLPSLREGMPTVVLEASSCKKAIITTMATGCIDSIIPGETGIFCEVTPNSIKSKIEYFISNPEKISQFGVNGRIYVEKNFSQKKVWEFIRTLYSINFNAYNNQV